MRRWILFASAALLLFWGVGLANPPVPPVLQGDTLGPEDGERNYQVRADVSVNTADEPAFALVMFHTPLEAREAADAVSAARRASAVVAGGGAAKAVGEPPAGESRSRIFALAAEEPIDAVVVYGSGDELRQVVRHPEVWTVEVLPSDAVWGAFTLTRNVSGGRV